MEVKLILHRVFEAGYLKFELPYDPAQMNKLKNIAQECHDRHGDYIMVTLKTPCRSRTLSQNGKIHAMIQEFAEYTGDELDYLKYELKVSAIRRGYPVKTDKNGDPLFSKRDGRPIPKSTTEITSEEATYLIEEIRQQAAEMGVFLSE